MYIGFRLNDQSTQYHFSNKSFDRGDNYVKKSKRKIEKKKLIELINEIGSMIKDL